MFWREKKSRCDLIWKHILSRIIMSCTHTQQFLHSLLWETSCSRLSHNRVGCVSMGWNVRTGILLCFCNVEKEEKNDTMPSYFQTWAWQWQLHKYLLLGLATSGDGGFISFQRNLHRHNTWLKVTHLSTWHFSLHLHGMSLRLFPRWGAVYGWKQWCGCTQSPAWAMFSVVICSLMLVFIADILLFFQMKTTFWWWPFVPQIVSVFLQNSL